jgi:signal transduction histidine kinase
LIITLLVHFSGGIQNPFFFLFILQVILSAIIFPGVVLPYLNAAVAALLLTLMSLFEFLGIVPFINLKRDVNSVSYLITVLSSFYIITFSGVYIINNFMKNYWPLKKNVEEKSSELEYLVEERNKAFRFAAHELKSPMVAIKSSLDLVLSLHWEDMTPATRNMVLRADKRTDQIINMVKEMISISQYSLGTQKQEFVTVEYDEWLTKLVLTYVDNALQKNISLSIVHLNDNFFVDIDKSGLESMVCNLVSNAIRYTPRGGKVFVITFRKKNCFGFSVKDTGIGISEEDKENIFSEFYRSKRAREMEQIGTGLGLNLVKEIVKINNGTITVESEVDKGSTFTVEFPLSNVESTEFEYHLVTKPYIFE